MLPDLTIFEWVSVSSFSLSLAALLARFFTKDERVSARSHLLTAVVVLALLSASLGTAYSIKRDTEVSKLSAEIYTALGNQQKTSDQLMIELGPQCALNFNAAMARLKSQGRVESEIEEIAVYGERLNAVRLWRALASQ